MLSPNRFRFLNVEGELEKLGDWNSKAFAKLSDDELVKLFQYSIDEARLDAKQQEIDWFQSDFFDNFS